MESTMEQERNEYSKTSVAVLWFTDQQFDDGIAHSIVEAITSNRELFPDHFVVTWKYLPNEHKWTISITE